MQLCGCPHAFWITIVEQMNKQAAGTILPDTAVCRILNFYGLCTFRETWKIHTFSYESLNIPDICEIYSYTPACCKSVSTCCLKLNYISSSWGWKWVRLHRIPTHWLARVLLLVQNNQLKSWFIRNQSLSSQPF